MELKLLYNTKDYHKLVECVARVCYQSQNKINKESHKMIKSIMKKGHLSIASVGNIVWGINHEYDETVSIYHDLVTLKQINNHVRWTTKDAKKNPGSNYDIVLSMNILSLLDIANSIDTYEVSEDEQNLFKHIMNSIKDVPEIKWFLDDLVKLPERENPYHASPNLLNPVMLSEDYTKLQTHLTKYNLEVHSTITVDFISDRASGLQLWRHGDQTGGCELSQRYVSRNNSDYRMPVDMVNEHELDLHNRFMSDHIQHYEDAFQIYKEYGYRTGRAKELARNYLPNIETRIIQCRPLKQWKHLFNLRDSVHAQKEVAEDVRAIKNEFTRKGIEIK
ncbi:FAD-dependent thymidylate synthase [Bacillus sp. SCS-151]|uniref:FAD-dependent thymidylate synthase n=1 Tax=Nanhaiella sioensis TaxID=3115293 RepID=UPI00397E0319